jgi:hypothetical protein
VKSHDELVADLLELFPDARTEVPVRIREGASEGRGYTNVRTSEGFVDVMFYMQPGKIHKRCASLVVCEVKSVHEKCSAGDIVRQLQRYQTGIDPTWIAACQEPLLCASCGSGPCEWVATASHVAKCAECARGGDCMTGRRVRVCQDCGAEGSSECDGTGEPWLALYTDRVLTKAEKLILDRANVVLL